MDGIGEDMRLVKLGLEKGPDLPGIFGAEEIPHGTAGLTVCTGRRVKHDVNGVGDVHMQPGAENIRDSI
jgi:hypothetical protein